jgi:hypothetical protein
VQRFYDNTGEGGKLSGTLSIGVAEDSGLFVSPVSERQPNAPITGLACNPKL